MRGFALTASRWLGVLTVLLAAVGFVGAWQRLVRFGALSPTLLWLLIPLATSIACAWGTWRGWPALIFGSIGLMWGITILGVSLLAPFIPAALAAALTGAAFAIQSLRSSLLAPVWFAIGLTAPCAIDVWYAWSRSYEGYWAGGYFSSRIDVPPIIVYGATLFVVLVSIVILTAVAKALASLKRERWRKTQ